MGSWSDLGDVLGEALEEAIDEELDGMEKDMDQAIGKMGGAVEEVVDNIGDVLKVDSTNLTHHRQLTPEEANCPCTAYTPNELLVTLNSITGKIHSMNRGLLQETLVAAYDRSKICDFGTIYSWYRLEATGSLGRGTDLWKPL